MTNCEVTILGSGIAAASAAAEFQKVGVDFLLIHNIQSVKHRPIWISENFTENFPQTKIGMRPTSYVRLVSPKADYRIKHKPGQYWIMDPVSAITAISDQILPEHKLNIQNMEKISIEKNHAGFFLKGLPDSLNTKKIIDATGITGITNQVNNFFVEHVYGGTFAGKLEFNEMILLFLPDGATCWIAPSIYPNKVDAMYTLWADKQSHNDFKVLAQKKLSELIQFSNDLPGIQFDSKNAEEIYEGMISAHYGRQKSINGIYPHGESAHIARPGSQESLNRILMATPILVNAILENWDTSKYLEALYKLRIKDGYVFAGMLIKTVLCQSKGLAGGTIENVKKMIDKLPVDQVENMTKKFENWIVDGNFDLDFVIKLLVSSKKLRQSLMLSGGAYLIAGLIGYNNFFDITHTVHTKIFNKKYWPD